MADKKRSKSARRKSFAWTRIARSPWLWLGVIAVVVLVVVALAAPPFYRRYQETRFAIAWREYKELSREVRRFRPGAADRNLVDRQRSAHNRAAAIDPIKAELLNMIQLSEDAHWHQEAEIVDWLKTSHMPADGDWTFRADWSTFQHRGNWFQVDVLGRQSTRSNEWPGARYDFYGWAPKKNVLFELERFEYSSEAAPQLNFEEQVQAWQESLVEAGRIRNQKKMPIRIGEFNGYELSGENEKGARTRIRMLARGRVVYRQFAQEYAGPDDLSSERFISSLQIRQ